MDEVWGKGALRDSDAEELEEKKVQSSPVVWMATAGRAIQVIAASHLCKTQCNNHHHKKKQPYTPNPLLIVLLFSK